MDERAIDALGTGKKVFFLDTERNLNNADISRLAGFHQYTSVFEEIKKITQHLPAVELVIIDSMGLPILTKFARMTMQEKGNALLDLIALMGDLKKWAYKHNAMAVVTNQPESEFAKPDGYKRKPFGNKSCFAAKEIWHVGTIRKDKDLTKSTMKAFRSRAMCTFPQIHLREKLFFRMIYETTTRPREVLESRIELWNRNTGEITFPTPRASTTDGPGVTSRARPGP